MAAQLVAQGEAQARRGIQLFNIGDPPSASASSRFQSAHSVALLTQTSALAMGFTLSPEQQAQALTMAAAMEDVVDEGEPGSEPPSSGVLVSPNEIPVEQHENW